MSALPNNNLQEHLARYSSSKGVGHEVIRQKDAVKPKRFIFRNPGVLQKSITPPTSVGFTEAARDSKTTVNENKLSQKSSLLSKGKNEKPKNILSFFSRTSTPLQVINENKEKRRVPALAGDSEDDDFDLSSSFCMKKSCVADLPKNKDKKEIQKETFRRNDIVAEKVSIGKNEYKQPTTFPVENLILPDVVPRKAEGCPVKSPPLPFQAPVLAAQSNDVEADFWKSDDEDIVDYIDIPTPSPTGIREEALQVDDSDVELFCSDEEERVSNCSFDTKVTEEEHEPNISSFQELHKQEQQLNVSNRNRDIRIRENSHPSCDNWKDKNYEVMTKICDCVARNAVILKQFPYIRNLVTERTEIMKQASFDTSPEPVSKPASLERKSVDWLSKPVPSGSFSLAKLDVSFRGSACQPSTVTSGPLIRTTLPQAFAENFSEDYGNVGAGHSVQYDCRKNNSGVPGKFIGNQHDDGASSRFKGTNFPHSQKLRHVFSEVFGLKEFRYNQLEAINAALLGEDCFVLMPTGGGKSLCYQLPALVTQGVAIVISPLRSLIQDQVQKLQSLDVSAEHLSGEQDAGTVNSIYSRLSRSIPAITLLYVTPEKVSASSKLLSMFEQLFKRKMLSRFIIDEAHCVSQWGHDFRPDYKRLKTLRDNFPGVPMMALTATATPRVRLDILHQLGMTKPKWFLQSFNRPNLKYEVLPKKMKSVDREIISLIKTKFQKKSGIVYCFSRRDCDNLAEVLKKENIKAVSYHAGIAGPERNSVQETWINDRVQVICATIAFGMGIDKPDVRFVIHQSLPKSVECFYQESGRAGRDGELSWCYLFYSYQDMHRMRRMVERDTENFQAKQMHINNLHRMVQFCENRTDCRRVQMLQYFGEIFNKTFCHTHRRTSCDNCSSTEVYECCDVTEDCKAVVQCLSNLVAGNGRGKNFTLIYLVDIFRGSNNAKIQAAGHNKLPLHGKGQKYHRSDAERLLQKLVLEGFLREQMIITQLEHAVVYVHPGPRASDLLQGKIKITFQMREKTKPADLAQVDETLEDPQARELSERCYTALVDLSKEIGEKAGIHYTNVVNVKALRQMSRDMPMLETDMLKIPHVTRAIYDKYGQQFLDITQRFGAERIVLDAEKADAMDQSFEMDVAGGSETTRSGRGQKRPRKTWGKANAKRFKKGGTGKQLKTNSKTSSGVTRTYKGKQNGRTKKSTAPPAIPRKNLPGFLPSAKARSFLPVPHVFSV